MYLYQYPDQPDRLGALPVAEPTSRVVDPEAVDADTLISKLQARGEAGGAAPMQIAAYDLRDAGLLAELKKALVMVLAFTGAVSADQAPALDWYEKPWGPDATALMRKLGVEGAVDAAGLPTGSGVYYVGYYLLLATEPNNPGYMVSWAPNLYGWVLATFEELKTAGAEPRIIKPEGAAAPEKKEKKGMFPLIAGAVVGGGVGFVAAGAPGAAVGALGGALVGNWVAA